MPKTIRQYWNSVSDGERLNFNWDAINPDSVVMVTAAEHHPKSTDQHHEPRFVGSANIRVANVAPHGPPHDPNQGVAFVVSSNWPIPLPIVTDITVLDGPPVDIEFQDPPDRFQHDISSISFGSGIAIGGEAHATVWRDGNWEFRGHLHDSGFVDYNTSVVVLLKDAANRVYSFQHGGHAAGTTGSGSRDDDWADNGQHPDIAANWWDIAAAPTWASQADVSGDLTNLVNEVIGTLGTVLGIIALIPTGHGDAPKAGDGAPA